MNPFDVQNLKIFNHNKSVGGMSAPDTSKYGPLDSADPSGAQLKFYFNRTLMRYYSRYCSG